MYRATPHSVTLRTPAELMFNRNIRDKLPAIHQHRDPDDELRDRDAEMKSKGKEYADRKRHAKQSDVKEGDEVVAKRQVVTNKLATKFEPTVYTVVNRSGAEVTIENASTGSQYKRNVAHVKKLPPSNTEDNHTELSAPAVSEAAISDQSLPPPTAANRISTRSRRMPDYYKDYDTGRKKPTGN